MVTKSIRFYVPMLVDQDENRVELEPGFWQVVRERIDELEEPQRQVRSSGADYYGDQGVGVARALQYLRIGRIRDRAEWPDILRADYDVEPLVIADGKLFEPAYLVPFGTGNVVAHMGPIRGVVSVRALEVWLTTILDLPQEGESIELVQVLDRALATKIAQADGVVKVGIVMPPGQTFEVSEQITPSQIERAAQQASMAAEGELTATVILSSGHSLPPQDMRQQLLQMVRHVADGLVTGVSRLDFTLLLPDGDGFKRESHELFSDHIAIMVRQEVQSDQPLGVEDCLDLIARGIEQYREL